MKEHVLLLVMGLLVACSGSHARQESAINHLGPSDPYWFLNAGQGIETDEEYQAAWDGLPVERIEFSRTHNGLYGAPFYWAVLSSDGVAKYSGTMINRLEGEYEGELHLWDYARLCQSVEHFRIGNMEERYRAPTSHAELVNVNIHLKDGSVIQVSDYGTASPLEYQAFCAMIEKVLYEMDWEPADTPLQRPSR